MTKELLASFEVFHDFVAFLRAFGRRPDPNFGGCKYRIHFSVPDRGVSVAQPLFSYEICYNFKLAIYRGGNPPFNWQIEQTVRGPFA